MIKEQLLDNGLQIVFTDESNRYFGDYHRICVVATIVCNLNDLLTETADDESFFLFIISFCFLFKTLSGVLTVILFSIIKIYQETSDHDI